MPAQAASQRRKVRAALSPGLFLSDEDLRLLICPRVGRDRFRSALRVLDREGFPKANPLFKGRYWPAVVAWLDEHNGVGNDGPIGAAEDGPENFDAPAQRPARPEVEHSRRRSTALLGRLTDNTRQQGLPGQDNKASERCGRRDAR